MAARDAARRRGPARQRPEPAGNGPANGPAAALRRPVTAAGSPARLPAARRGAGPRPGGVCVCGGRPRVFSFFPPFLLKMAGGGLRGLWGVLWRWGSRFAPRCGEGGGWHGASWAGGGGSAVGVCTGPLREFVCLRVS